MTLILAKVADENCNHQFILRKVVALEPNLAKGLEWATSHDRNLRKESPISNPQSQS
jgi:hypothetical protein